MEVTCLNCHKDMDDRTGIRSLTWYGGLAGTRAILCSPECQKAWDNDNLSQVADMIEDEVTE
jgi:hypothetical protein